MNKKITLSVSLSLFAVLLCGTLIYTIYTNGDKSAQNPAAAQPAPSFVSAYSDAYKYCADASDDEGCFLDKSKEGYRTVLYRGKNLTLVYCYTENNTKQSAAKRSDFYGIYDVYEDEQGVEYGFFYNTDIPCYMLGKSSEPYEPEERIDKDRAIELAKEYLITVFSKEVFGAYEFESFNESTNSPPTYGIMFNKPLGDYKTDDGIYICMHTDGHITSFGATDLSHYDCFQDIAGKIDGEKNRAAMEKVLAAQWPNIRYHIEGDGRITLDDNGELAFSYGVVFTDKVTYAEHFWQPIDLG